MVKNEVFGCINAVKNYPLLTADEEIELGRRIKEEHDEEAREKLILCNLRLVIYIATRFHSSKLGLADLIQEGNSGLVTAVDKFDYKKGYRFSTSATFWIKQAILKSITDKGKTVRLPAHVYQQLSKMKKAIIEYENTHHKEPTNEELADILNVDVEKIDFLKDCSQESVSLDTPLDDTDRNTVGDLIVDDENETPEDYADKMLKIDLVKEILSKYPPRTQIIMKMRYGLGKEDDPKEFSKEHTLEETGAYVNITRERVRQIEKATLDDIRVNYRL